MKFSIDFQQICFHYKWRFCMYCITYGNCVTSIMNNHVFQSSLLIMFHHKSKPCSTLPRLLTLCVLYTTFWWLCWGLTFKMCTNCNSNSVVIVISFISQKLIQKQTNKQTPEFKSSYVIRKLKTFYSFLLQSNRCPNVKQSMWISASWCRKLSSRL